MIVRGEMRRHDACISCAAKHCFTRITVAYRYPTSVRPTCHHVNSTRNVYFHVQVFVTEMAAWGKRVQLLHDPVAPGSPVCIYGVSGARSSRWVSICFYRLKTKLSYTYKMCKLRRRQITLWQSRQSFCISIAYFAEIHVGRTACKSLPSSDRKNMFTVAYMSRCSYRLLTCNIEMFRGPCSDWSWDSDICLLLQFICLFTANGGLTQSHCLIQ